MWIFPASNVYAVRGARSVPRKFLSHVAFGKKKTLAGSFVPLAKKAFDPPLFETKETFCRQRKACLFKKTGRQNRPEGSTSTGILRKGATRLLAFHVSSVGPNEDFSFSIGVLRFPKNSHAVEISISKTPEPDQARDLRRRVCFFGLVKSVSRRVEISPKLKYTTKIEFFPLYFTTAMFLDR